MPEINNFNELRLRNDSGFLFEGFILSELLKRGNKGIRFWQDKNFNEVDFILEKDGKSIPLEVKFKEELKLENQKSLNVFLESYAQVVEGVIINLSKQKKDKSVRFILPYNLDTV